MKGTAEQVPDELKGSVQDRRGTDVEAKSDNDNRVSTSASALLRQTMKSVISVKKAEENKLNPLTVIKIIAFWLLTVPTALGVAYILTYVLLY